MSEDELSLPGVWGEMTAKPEAATVDVAAYDGDNVRLRVQARGDAPRGGLCVTTLLSAAQADDLANDLEAAAVEVAEQRRAEATDD